MNERIVMRINEAVVSELEGPHVLANRFGWKTIRC